MKFEWKKQEKELYGAKQIPAVITVPVQSYIMISGKGNPNDEDFSNIVCTVCREKQANLHGIVTDSPVSCFILPVFPVPIPHPPDSPASVP